jgi:hypothetical protein
MTHEPTPIGIRDDPLIRPPISTIEHSSNESTTHADLQVEPMKAFSKDNLPESLSVQLLCTACYSVYSQLCCFS